MTHRRTLAPTALTLVAALAACTPNDTATASGSAQHTTTAGAAGTASASPKAPGSPCTVAFPGGTGISVHAGTVTGRMTLACPGDPNWASVNLALFYRPDTAHATTTPASASAQTYRSTYSVTAHCEPGLWYLGEFFSAAAPEGDYPATPPAHSTTLTIHTCG